VEPLKPAEAIYYYGDKHLENKRPDLEYEGVSSTWWRLKEKKVCIVHAIH
jgi:hypothetical protein